MRVAKIIIFGGEVVKKFRCQNCGFNSSLNVTKGTVNKRIILVEMEDILHQLLRGL